MQVCFAGKALAKYAAIVYTANTLVNNKAIAAAGLLKLQEAFAIWVENQAESTLVYGTVWKGIVSESGYMDVNSDYGGRRSLCYCLNPVDMNDAKLQSTTIIPWAFFSQNSFDPLWLDGGASRS